MRKSQKAVLALMLLSVACLASLPPTQRYYKDDSFYSYNIGDGKRFKSSRDKEYKLDHYYESRRFIFKRRSETSSYTSRSKIHESEFESNTTRYYKYSIDYGRLLVEVVIVIFLGATFMVIISIVGKRKKHERDETT